MARKCKHTKSVTSRPARIVLESGHEIVNITGVLVTVCPSCGQFHVEQARPIEGE